MDCQTLTGPEIRARRAAAGISGDLLCRKAAIKRSKLSGIERGHIHPTDDEMVRIGVALEDLVSARKQLLSIAAELVWPPEAL